MSRFNDILYLVIKLKKNQGFTLIEVLAVIVIIGILATVGGASVFTVLDSQKKELAKEQVASLKDTAITYVESKKWYLRDCPNTFDEKNPDEAQKNICYKEVTVQQIIDADFFENKSNLCDTTKKIIVYKKKYTTAEGNAFSELKSYTSDDICTYGE